MWMQLNSTNGGSVHDTVSLARQTECFPNPAGFISGAHLVKGQQKVSAQGRVKKLSATAAFRSGGCIFSAQLEAFLLTRVRFLLDKRQLPCSVQTRSFPKPVKSEAAANRLVKEEGLNNQVATVKRNGCLL